MDLSIIVINKNYKNFLKVCIESCLNQETKYVYEVLFIDDGSNDGSLEYVKKIKNKKLKVYYAKNQGVEKAANKILKKAKGKYVLRVDSDDFLKKNFVNIMLKKIIGTNYTFVYSNYYIIDVRGKLIRNVKLPSFNPKEIFERGDFLATGTLIKRRSLKSLNYYNEKYKNCGLENYELILKLLLLNKKGKHIKKCLFYYRKHFKNLSIIKRKKIVKYGNLLFKNLKLGKYMINHNHPMAK